VRTVARGVVSENGLILSQAFHPGATEIGRATPVTVRAGEERGGIDIQLQYVPLSTVGGVLSSASGWTPGMLTMARTDEVPGFDPVRQVRAEADGRFTFNSVTPGQYRIFARISQPPGNIQVAFADVAVDGEDVTNVSFTLQPPLTISGRTRSRERRRHLRSRISACPCRLR
jgi:hypothetical protein